MAYFVKSSRFFYSSSYEVDESIVGQLCELNKPIWVRYVIPEEDYAKVGKIILDVVSARLRIAKNSRFFRNIELACRELICDVRGSKPNYTLNAISGSIFNQDLYDIFDKVYGTTKEAMQTEYIDDIRVDIINNCRYLKSVGLGDERMSDLPYFSNYTSVDEYGSSVNEILNYFATTHMKVSEWRQYTTVRNRTTDLVKFLRKVK